ncbi:MAG TPA: hypothetical protein VHK47_04235 [Polyangia bacterium]|nr:hypothetical protein [Polyangia bacterium]
MLRRHLLTSLFALSVVAVSCGGSGGGGGDGTAKFVGAWTFQSGELAPMCLGSTLTAFDLMGLPVTFAKVDASTISLTINPQCSVKFTVNGDHATAPAGQMCTLDLGGTLGIQPIMITKWTLALSGDQIDNDIAGSASLCTAAGTAVLARGTSDAGAGG